MLLRRLQILNLKRDPLIFEDVFLLKRKKKNVFLFFFLPEKNVPIINVPTVTDICEAYRSLSFNF